MVAEGVALAYYGLRYLDFMERNGLMDFGKKLLRASGLRNHKALAVIGITEAVLGAGLISSARRTEQRAIAA
jgi:hypothetical protein